MFGVCVVGNRLCIHSGVENKILFKLNRNAHTQETETYRKQMRVWGTKGKQQNKEPTEMVVLAWKQINPQER